MSATPTTRDHTAAGTAAALRLVLDGRYHHLREEIRATHRADWFTPRAHEDDEAHRRWVGTAMHELSRTPHQLVGFPVAYGGQDDLGGSVAAFEMLALGDLSLTVKVGVQWGLFGGAVQALGTKAHHDRLVPPLMDYTLAGCFAMTESGHGSDVQGLRTTATYDPATQEFVVHTPDEQARKDYIGNAARDGRMAVVFAQLRTAGRDQGVHALLVPIRDEQGEPAAGVTISDCGAKGGLGGVDNGRLRFDHVRVPREALLDRYASVAPDGTYSSPIASANRRFFTMLGALVRGRISISGAAISAAKVGLDIAVRHGQDRRQFSDPDTGEEVRLLDHPSHQRKLLPALARVYALSFAQSDVADALQRAHRAGPAEGGDRSLETEAAAVKAAATWTTAATLQTAREACGGVGYLAATRLTVLRADTDVFTTFEGDNTVLMQLVAKNLLSDLAAGARTPVGAARAAVRSWRLRAPGRRLAGARTSLLDPDRQLRLLRDREAYLLDHLARGLRADVAAGRTAAAAGSAAQPAMVALGHAHAERVMLEAFDARVRGEDAALDGGAVPDGATRAVLARLRDLFVLQGLERDLGWYLAHGRITRREARTVGAHVGRLCAELRPDALTLVDAFGIDPAWAGRRTAPVELQILAA